MRERIRFTRGGIYFYHRRYTLSFTWKCRWHWLPFRGIRDCNGSYGFGWGYWMIEKLCFDPCDDWGVGQAKLAARIFEQLTTGKGPLIDLVEEERE